MSEGKPHFHTVRFGNFEVDLRSGELRRAGMKLKLSAQPFQLLTILLERPGEVVTREELQKRLWSDTFVDVDHNLNTSINKIREVLGDSTESPRFIETLPRRGYRFIAHVEHGLDFFAGSIQAAPPHKTVITRIKYHRLALLCILIFSIGMLVFWKLRASGPGAVPRVLSFEKLTNDSQAKYGPLTTDGSRIYFNEVLADGRNIIAQVSVKGGEVVPLPVPLQQPRALDLSKEGTELLIATFQGPHQANPLWVQPVAGGSPNNVARVLTRDASFDADGTGIIYTFDIHDIYRANLDGSAGKKLFTVEGYPYGFRFSPDASILRFTQRDYAMDAVTITETRTDGTGLRKLFEGCCGQWTPDGRFFIFQKIVKGKPNLWVIPEAGSHHRAVAGNATQLTAGPLDFEYPVLSKDAKKIFSIGSTPQAEVVRYDTRSRDFVPYLGSISAEGLAFSSDGQWVTYTSYPDGMLWRSKVDGSERLQLTFPPMRVMLPRWSPDGKRIAFSAIVPGTPWSIYAISSGGGTALRVLPSDQGQLDADWSPDGNSLVFGCPFVPTAPISIVDLRSKHVSVLPGSNGLFSPRWSPDGKYISGTTIDAFKLLLFDFSKQRWTVVSDPFVGYPVWSRDGTYLYFEYSPRPEDLDRIVRYRPSDHKIESVAELSNVGRLTTGTSGNWFGLAPDGSPLFARDISAKEIYGLEVEWH